MGYNKYIETNYIMFEIKMTREEIIEGLKANYGKEFTAADAKGFCAMNDIAYQTVTKKIEQFKVGRGKWNLEVTVKAVKSIENSFNAPAVEPKLEQNLIPETDDTFVRFGPFSDIKTILKTRMFYPTFITGLSGNGKPLESNKLVLNSSEN